MKSGLKDRVALVTGAGSGIGKAIALRLAEEGVKVGVNDLNSAAIEQTLNELKNTSGQGLSLQADVSDVAQVKEMFEKLISEWSTIDILVNNAGIRDPDKEFSKRTEAAFLKAGGEIKTTGRIQESMKLTSTFTDEWWHKIININLNSMFYCTREALKIMEENRSGKIINMASIMGISGGPNAAYGASKGAMIAFTKGLAKEVLGSGIQVNAVAPGIIETPLYAEDDQSMPVLLAQIPIGRFGASEEIADTVVFLAGNQAEYYVGQVLSPNGGMVI